MRLWVFDEPDCYEVTVVHAKDEAERDAILKKKDADADLEQRVRAEKYGWEFIPSTFFKTYGPGGSQELKEVTEPGFWSHDG